MQEDDREIADYTSARGSCIYLSNALQILQNLFIYQRGFKSIDFTVHINMEPDHIETYFGLKLVSLGGHCSSRQCQKVSRNSGGFQHFSRIWEKSRNSGGGGGSGLFF